MKARGKERHPKEIVYGALVALPFDQITVGVSQTNAAIQARIPLPFDFKCYRVMVVPGASIAGLTSFNIVVGEAAEGSVTTDDQSDFGAASPPTYNYNTTAGTKLFTADQAVVNTVGSAQTFTPTNPEAVFQQGTELTLRIVSTAGGAGTVKVLLAGRFIDTHPTKPMSSTQAALNVATDL